MVRAVSAARDQARELLALLETQGHPQTGQSSSLYLALVSLLKRMSRDAPTPSVVAAELQQLTALCEGKLSPIKPLLENARRIADGA